MYQIEPAWMKGPFKAIQTDNTIELLTSCSEGSLQILLSCFNHNIGCDLKGRMTRPFCLLYT